MNKCDMVRSGDGWCGAASDHFAPGVIEAVIHTRVIQHLIQLIFTPMDNYQLLLLIVVHTMRIPGAGGLPLWLHVLPRDAIPLQQLVVKLQKFEHV